MEADILNVPNIILRKKIILTLFKKKHGLSFINVAVEKPQRNAKTWAETLFLVQIIALPCQPVMGAIIIHDSHV